ncbi:hypothetical protein PINS_up001559 [Pythium insidiosum]|nr:hypothetical protein PINS_up001559 [Pythium insidiosum]
MNPSSHLTRQHHSAPPPALHVRVHYAPSSSHSSSSQSLWSSSSMLPPSSSGITRSERSSHARAVLTASALDAQFVICRGYLRLRDAARDWRMKTWCCVLLRHELRWYATERDARQARRPVGRVVVVVARRSDGHGKLHVYPHAFTIETQDGRVLFCSAPSEADQRRWIEAVNTGAAAVSAPSASSAQSDRSTFVERGMSLRDEDVEADADVPSSSATTTTTPQSLPLSPPSCPSSASSSPSPRSCTACGIAFGVVFRQRRQCQRCRFFFCRAHCSSYTLLESSKSFVASSSSSPCSSSSSSSPVVSPMVPAASPALSPASSPATSPTHPPSSASRSPAASSSRVRVCESCAYRDHFITFVVAFTAKAILKIRADRVNVGHVLSRGTGNGSSNNDQESAARSEGRAELSVLLSDPARFTVPNVLCLLKKHLDEPREFVRALALLIPLLERDPQSVEEYWVQLLTLFVPLLQTREPFSPAMQFFLRFIFAACRRSNTFALRTMWECLAFHEDARLRGDRVTMSYLMLLLHSSSAFYGSSEFVMNKLLQHAPAEVASQIRTVLDDFLRVREVLRDEIPDSLPAQWFNALCCHEIASASRLVTLVFFGQGRRATAGAPRSFCDLVSRHFEFSAWLRKSRHATGRDV